MNAEDKCLDEAEQAIALSRTAPNQMLKQEWITIAAEWLLMAKSESSEPVQDKVLALS
jgi:hypothetical protein